MPDFKFSANTGFLWRELPFPERIRKAGEFKFDAVEFHDEAQRYDLNAIAGLLEEHDLPLISMNTDMGENFGTSALPGCERETRTAIDAAITTAETLKAHAIHVLSGCAHGKEARKTFVSSLTYALERTEKTILIEPISEASVSGYFVGNLELAVSIIEEISHPRLKIMFDCFHIRQEYSDLGKIFAKHVNLIEHVQIASFPDRNEPFDGEIEYSDLLFVMKNAGYDGFFGCEYAPENTVETGINWRETFEQ